MQIFIIIQNVRLAVRLRSDHVRRKLGCKEYVLDFKADRRRDWEDKSMVGYFIGYARSKVGYHVLLGDLNVLIDKSIPERPTDNFYKV